MGRSGEDESQEDVLMDEAPSNLSQSSTLQANREGEVLPRSNTEFRKVLAIILQNGGAAWHCRIRVILHATKDASLKLPPEEPRGCLRPGFVILLLSGEENMMPGGQLEESSLMQDNKLNLPVVAMLKFCTKEQLIGHETNMVGGRRP